MRYEAVRPKIPQLHFKAEGYISSSDVEFLEHFLNFLKDKGFKPEDLIFSGFDGTSVAKGESIQRHPIIFGMNEAGWREAIRTLEGNPAEYAESWDTPCVGIYDKSQLAEVYSSEMLADQEDINSRIEHSEVVLGEYLSDLDPATPFEEALAHKDYPNGSPTDALVGLVYLDRK